MGIDFGENPSTLDRYFWARHANPLSGWSRVAAGPLLMACLYRRDWRGLAVTLAFVVVNPFLFPPPESDDAWMTRGVLGERLWTDEARKYRRYPGLLTALSGVTWLYAVYAAVRQRPAETALATALSMALKFWFVAEVAHLYDADQRAESDG